MKNIGILSLLVLLFSACAEDLQPESSSQTHRQMDYPLSAELTILDKNDYWAKIVLSNPNSYDESFHQPMAFEPYEEWEYSKEAYQISVLQSFHLLKMSVSNEKGDTIDQNTILTMADHIFMERVLDSNQTIEILVPISEFYDLNRGKYSFEFYYGHDTILAGGEVDFEVD